MDPNRDMYNNPGQLPIAPGTDVFDINGEKIGSVQQYSPQSNYLVLQKGAIFKKDIYVPLSALDSVTTDGVRLNLSKDDLKEDRYQGPPMSGMNTPRAADDDLLP